MDRCSVLIITLFYVHQLHRMCTILSWKYIQGDPRLADITAGDISYVFMIKKVKTDMNPLLNGY